jgi:hypothetical protein
MFSLQIILAVIAPKMENMNANLFLHQPENNEPAA